MSDASFRRRACTLSPRGANSLARDELQHRRVHVGLDGQHARSVPLGRRVQPLEDPALAIMWRESPIHLPRRGQGKRILIGADENPGRRIVKRRELLKWDQTIPFEIARRTIHGHVTCKCPAQRKSASHLVPDIAVHIGIQEVQPGPREAAQGFPEFIPVLRPIDGEQWEGRTGLRRRPLQRQRLAGFPHHDGPMHRPPRLDTFCGAPPRTAIQSVSFTAFIPRLRYKNRPLAMSMVSA